MALYDDRLADLSEARRKPLARNPLLRRSASEAARRPSMSAQSLLFDRSAGWTESKAKAWAKSHGYRYGKVDVTDQYVRIRQFDPKGSKVKRTIPFGRGIRAVVAREESSNMARTSTVKSPRRKRRRTAKKKTSSGRRHRRVRASVAAPKRRRHRRAKKAAATTRRRRRRTVRVEAKRSRRRSSGMVMAPRRRRRRVTREAWKADSEGHAKAARKGHRRRKARKSAPRRRSRRKARESVMESPRRRRRHRRARETTVMQSPRRRRRHQVYASRRGGGGMGVGEMVLATASAGFGFVLADGIDRLLATYNPSSTDEPPKDKFTSSGTGTLANTLNVASMPDWKRLVASVGLTAAPAVGAMFTDGYARSALEGAAIGAGVNFIKLLVNNVLMPMLVGKDTSAPELKKSYIARLYPAEVAARINRVAAKGPDGKTPPGPYDSTGVLSGAQDVGPFALSGDSPYPTADQALRSGVSGDSPYPTAAQALRAGVSGDSPYPTAAQALRTEAGLHGWQPGPPAGPGPGPQAEPHTDPSCGCVGDPTVAFSSFLGEAPAED